MSTTIHGTTGINRIEPTAYGLPLSHRNKIINGNFRVNQRAYVSGTNVGAANTYTLDRWRVVTSGQNITFTASGNGNLVTAPAGGLEQVIEGVNIEGGTYVLNWTGTATATVNGTARAKGESFTLPANTNATVRLIGGTASQVQIEPGSVATPFEHRPIGAELALCQRYYETGSAFGQSAATHSFGSTIPYKATKRASPTLAFSSITYSGASTLTSTTVLLADSTAQFAWNAVASAIAGYVTFNWTSASEL